MSSIYKLILSDDIQVTISSNMLNKSKVLQDMFSDVTIASCDKINSLVFHNLITFTKDCDDIDQLIDVVYASDYFKLKEIQKQSTDLLSSLINDKSVEELQELRSRQTEVSQKSCENTQAC